MLGTGLGGVREFEHVELGKLKRLAPAAVIEVVEENFLRGGAAEPVEVFHLETAHLGVNEVVSRAAMT